MKKNPSSIFLGTGFGSLVNLKFHAPLTSDDKGLKYISELHNGYPYVLYKTGMFGLVLYLFFLIKLYMKIYIKYSFEIVFISAIGIFNLFSTLTITGIYNTSDIIVFILGALLFELENYLHFMLFTRQKRLKLSNFSKTRLKPSVSLSVIYYNYSRNEISYIPLLLLARKLSCTITLTLNIIPSVGMFVYIDSASAVKKRALGGS